jgi:hypothetical protein
MHAAHNYRACWVYAMLCTMRSTYSVIGLGFAQIAVAKQWLLSAEIR